MAESTLSIAYADLLVAVAVFLGYSPTAEDWTDAQTAQLDRIVQSGYRLFLFPAGMEGIEAGYEWSFLKPWTTLEMTADDEDQDLPDDFGGLIDGFHFAAGTGYAPVRAPVSVGDVLDERRRISTTGWPRIAAIRAKSSDGSDGQRAEVMWWPTPDSAYVVSYRYAAYTGKLTSVIKYPLGGMEHSETLTESCLAAAERSIEDVSGLHREAFRGLLSSSITRDKRRGAMFFGNVGNRVELGQSGEGLGFDYSLTVSDVVVQ